MKSVSFGEMKQLLSVSKIFLIMRLCLILFICSVFQSFAATTYSQTTILSLHLNNVSVEEVLNEIEAQSEYRFLYNKRTVDVTRKVSVSLDDQEITAILDNLFDNKQVSYMISDRQVVLNPVEAKAIHQQKKEGLRTGGGCFRSECDRGKCH